MEDSDINKLRNIPPFYDNVLLLGGYKPEPDSCNKRLKYKDMEIEKQNFSKIKEEFQTQYSFENCKLAGVKVSWGKLNYIKVAGCNAKGSSFTQVELSYGEGIADSRMEKGKIRNFGIHNMPIYRSTMVGSKFEERVYLHNIGLVECTGELLRRIILISIRLNLLKTNSLICKWITYWDNSYTPKEIFFAMSVSVTDVSRIVNSLETNLKK